MTQTALEARIQAIAPHCIRDIEDSPAEDWIALSDVERIISALTAPVGLEFVRNGNTLQFNGKVIGCVKPIGFPPDVGWTAELLFNYVAYVPIGADEEVGSRVSFDKAFDMLEAAAREWLRIPTQPNVTELVEALAEFDRLSLVVESGVRTCNGADHQNTKDVWALIKKTRATLSRAKGG